MGNKKEKILIIGADGFLSAHLLAVPGKKAGEMTDFKSPYLVDWE